MLSILTITLPIFLLIAAGYLVTRTGFFSPDQIRGLGRFVIAVALPALVFRALVQRPFGEVFNARYLLVYGAASLAMLLGGFAWFRLVRGRGVTTSGLRGLGMAASNSGFMGFPVALQFLGPPAAVALALTMIVENLLIIPAALALAEAGSSAHRSPKAVVRGILVNLARNPLILAIVSGALFALLGLHLPEPLARAVSLLADASAPVALFAIGGTLVGLRVSGLVGEIAQVAGAKLILHPLAVLALLLVVPIADPNLRRAAILFACIPMPTIYPIIGHRYGEEQFCAAALLAATTASFATVSVVLWLVARWMPLG